MKRRELLRLGLGFPALWAVAPGFAISNEAAPWADIFARMPAPLAGLVDRREHEIQILYTRIDRDAHGHPHFREFVYGLAPRRWFPAASLAKMPLALLAAEELQARGLDFGTALAPEGASWSGEWPADEPAAEPFERSLRRIFSVSENPPFNRLYDFLGADAIAARLATLGYPRTRLISRLGAPSGDGRHTRAGRLLDAEGVMQQRWPERMAADRSFPFGAALKGAGWQADDGTVTPGPHDFSRGNFLPLVDGQRMLRALVFPEAEPPHRRWALTAADRDMLLKTMAMMPRGSEDPIYDERDHPDGYARFLVLGDRAERKPDDLRLFGKVGQAYGYLADSEYLVEPARGVECLISAAIYVNADGILNDDKYEYDTLGIPFLAALGRAVLDHERTRPRRHPARFDHLPA